MSIDASRIVTLTTNIYRSATSPNSNAFMVLTAGVPAGSPVHLGASGIPDVSPGIEIVEKDSENQLAVLGASISKHTMDLTIRLKEWTTEGLSWLMGGRQVGNGFFGGSTSDVEYDTLTIVWCFDEDAGVYGFFHAYKAYVSSPAPLSPQKGEAQELEATFTAVSDTTRAKTDQLYQIWNPEPYVDL